MPSETDVQLKSTLLHLLQSECRGRLAGLTHRRLAERLHCIVRRERRLVNELVVAGYRIATSSRWGVFWVVDAEDARVGRGELCDKAYPVMERLRAYDRACAEVLVPEQGSLWEGDAGDVPSKALDAKWGGGYGNTTPRAVALATRYRRPTMPDNPNTYDDMRDSFCPEKKHCSCVPILKEKIEQLEGWLTDRDAQIAAMAAEIGTIAEESILPDGDGVSVPVVLWAESVVERLGAIAQQPPDTLVEKITELGRQLREAKGDYQDFLNFMRNELAAFPCCHEAGYHADTPPLMWPELVRCIAARAEADAFEAGRAEAKAEQRAAYWADQKPEPAP